MTGKKSKRNVVLKCCLMDDDKHCKQFAGSAVYGRRIVRLITDQNLNLRLNPKARHTNMCNYHRDILQIAKIEYKRNNKKRMRSPEINMHLLTVKTLRRYKSYYNIRAGRGWNKARLVNAVEEHLKTLPINETEIINNFIHMVITNGNKLDKKE
ncbi:histone deacetylase complex subunit SAP30 homolog [Galleria mellonella]|uniref:Histone deacetylase complex subunit SAP30 homolog n=1 Tax=Galleria mellonella TaxID=7137 RepID=A0A6J3C0S9_GALME|nr:histone deacetylase complex subunit SAP30 homolog [Galleria mellonella]